MRAASLSGRRGKLGFFGMDYVASLAGEKML
jgi:hypothetical protein